MKINSEKLYPIAVHLVQNPIVGISDIGRPEGRDMRGGRAGRGGGGGRREGIRNNSPFQGCS